MKKITLLTVTVLSFIILNAQVKIGAKAAWNYSGGSAVYTAVKQSTSYTNGFGIGAMAKIPFDGPLHFSPSVMINKRGFTVNKPANSTNQKEQYSITYLDLIAALSADFENGNNAFSIAVGPVFGFTNFGKLKITDNAGVKGTQNLKFGYGAYGWADIGLQSSVSYRINKVAVEAGYYLGFANINNQEETDGRNMKHRVISLGIGYYFKQTAH
jgi:Outer membrane protein beta-barrel domain